MTETTVDLGIDGLTNIEVVGAGGTAIVYRADRVPDADGDEASGDADVASESDVGGPKNFEPQAHEFDDVHSDDHDAENGVSPADLLVDETADPDTVAIKVLRLAWDPAALARFEREQRVMSRLSQMSGFVSILETGEASDGSPYIVMPYYAGGSLQDRIRTNGPMAWPRAVRLIEQVAQTLIEAHRHDVFHRDIKPANILLSESGQAHVADFGISVMADENLGRNTMAAFTPAYSPPESFSDGLRPVASTDVYGLAATLWALLAGHAPFKEKDEKVTTATIFGRVATQQIGDLRPRVPSPICYFLEQAVAKRPEERPASMVEFLQGLREAREDAYRGLERSRFDHKPLELTGQTPDLAKLPAYDTESPTLAGPIAASTTGDFRGSDLVILGRDGGHQAAEHEGVTVATVAASPETSSSPLPAAADAPRSASKALRPSSGQHPVVGRRSQRHQVGGRVRPSQPSSALSSVLTALVAALVTSGLVLTVWFLGSRLLGG